jgi:UDPglucose 6-dehydrogenase
MKGTLSIIGLGKLGASMVAGIADRGIPVIGVDVKRRAVELVNEGRAPVQETDLEKTLSRNKERIRATMSHEEAICGSELTFVIVPTPSDERGAFSLEYAAYAFREIGKALARKKEYHTIVLTSTVLPGAMRYGLMPILERYSGKRCGPDFGLCYSPEFIALGSIIRDFLNPDFVLLGEHDAKTGEHCESWYRKFMANNPPIKRMSLENAELTKISLNAYVTQKITFANMLADLCNSIPGGDVDVVADALGADSRIGRKYLTGALGFGGPCFPRDNVALAFVAESLGVRSDMPRMTDNLNRSIVDRVMGIYGKHFVKGRTVAVLGLAYKPASHITEESQSVALTRVLIQRGARVVAYDPLANDMVRSEMGDRVVLMESVKDSLAHADVVLVTTPDPEFKRLTPADFASDGRTVTVIDFWRAIQPSVVKDARIEYIPFGRGLDNDAASQKLRELWERTALDGEE